jgi:hypothetical protein
MPRIYIGKQLSIIANLDREDLSIYLALDIEVIL